MPSSSITAAQISMIQLLGHQPNARLPLKRGLSNHDDSTDPHQTSLGPQFYHEWGPKLLLNLVKGQGIAARLRSNLSCSLQTTWKSSALPQFILRAVQLGGLTGEF